MKKLTVNKTSDDNNGMILTISRKMAKILTVGRHPYPIENLVPGVQSVKRSTVVENEGGLGRVAYFTQPKPLAFLPLRYYSYYFAAFY